MLASSSPPPLMRSQVRSSVFAPLTCQITMAQLWTYGIQPPPAAGLISSPPLDVGHLCRLHPDSLRSLHITLSFAVEVCYFTFSPLPSVDMRGIITRMPIFSRPRPPLCCLKCKPPPHHPCPWHLRSHEHAGPAVARHSPSHSCP